MMNEVENTAAKTIDIFKKLKAVTLKSKLDKISGLGILIERRYI